MGREPLAPGSLLQGGFYVVGNVVGLGGFSITYQAFQGSLRLPVAIKEFFPQGTVRQEGLIHPLAPWNRENLFSAREKFQREGEILARFHHDGVVRVHGQFLENESAYLVEELLQGETLGEGLARAGVMALPQALQVVQQVGQALMLVHAGGLVHSDLKPDNLFWTVEDRYVILDFGVSRGYLSSKASKEGMAAVSPGYSPPEQYDRNATLNPEADVYALAATLYHLLGGHPPLDARRRMKGEKLTGLRALNSTVTPEVELAIFQALHLDPKKRTSSVRVMMEQLHLEVSPKASQGPAVAEFSKVAEAPAHPGGVHALVLHQESARLFSAGKDGRIQLWSWPDFQLLGTLAAHSQAVQALAISPDGGYLASGSQGGEIRLWDATQGSPIQTLMGSGPGVQRLAFHPEGGVIAAAFTDGRCMLLGPSLPQAISWQAHRGPVNALDISPDGVFLATAGDDKVIHFWRLPDGRFLRSLKGHDRIVQSVRFSPDGRILLSASNDLSVRLWELSVQQDLRHIKGHKGMVWEAVFTSSPEFVATVSADRCLRVFRVDNGRLQACSEAHEGWTRALAADLTRPLFVTGGADGYLRVWSWG